VEPPPLRTLRLRADQRGADEPEPGRAAKPRARQRVPCRRGGPSHNRHSRGRSYSGDTAWHGQGRSLPRWVWKIEIGCERRVARSRCAFRVCGSGSSRFAGSGTATGHLSFAALVKLCKSFPRQAQGNSAARVRRRAGPDDSLQRCGAIEEPSPRDGRLVRPRSSVAARASGSLPSRLAAASEPSDPWRQ
jgi:hypothetical protein